MLRILNEYKGLYAWTIIAFAILYVSASHLETDPKSVVISAKQPYTLETSNVFIGNGETELFLVSTDKNFTITRVSDDTPVATGAIEAPGQFESETRFTTLFIAANGQEYTSDQTLQIFSKNQTTIQVKEYSIILMAITAISFIAFVALIIASVLFTIFSLFWQ